MPSLTAKRTAIVAMITVLLGASLDFPAAEDLGGQRQTPAAGTPGRQAIEEALQIRREVHAELAKLGCRATSEDVSSMARTLTQRIAPLAERGTLANGPYDFELNRTRRAACAIEQQGRAPALEQFLVAVGDGRRLDPCTYDPQVQYPQLDDPLYLDQGSAASYDEGSFNTDNFTRQLDESRRGDCFRNIIRAALTGRLANKPWVERSAGSTATASPTNSATSAAAERARVLADRAARCAALVAAAGKVRQPNIVLPSSQRVVGVADVDVDNCTVAVTTPDGARVVFVLDGKALLANLSVTSPQRSFDLNELVGATIQVSWFPLADGRPRATLVVMLKPKS